MTDDCVVYTDEIYSGIFLANTIVTPVNGMIPVKILNTTENEVTITELKPQLERLKDYNLCTFNKTRSNADRVKELFSYLHLNHLNKEEKITIESLCAKFSDIFQLPNDKLTTTNICKQNIHLKPNSSPVFVKPYRIPHSQKQELNKQINKLLENGIIEPAKSEWSSPVLLVPKKSKEGDGKKWRLVIDYRQLNNRIQDDKFPLPNITEILDSLSGAIYFSHLDLFSGYYQVSLDEKSRNCTAFCSGQYQINDQITHGLKNKS